jgi:hypothetical protein
MKMAVVIWILAFMITMTCSGMGQYFSSMTIKPKDTGTIFIRDADSEDDCIIRCVDYGGCQAVVYSDPQSACTGYNHTYYSGITLNRVLEHGWKVEGEFQEKMHTMPAKCLLCSNVIL